MGFQPKSSQHFIYNLQGRLSTVINEDYTDCTLSSRTRTTSEYDSKSYRVQIVNASGAALGSLDSETWTPTNEICKAYSDREDRCLRPIEIQDPAQLDVSNPAKKSVHRCSEQGLLPMSVGDHISLVDMTSRLHQAGKSEDPPEEWSKELPPILQRLDMNLETWKLWTQEFSSLFSQAAGNAKTMEAARTLVSDRKYFCRAHRGKKA